MPKDKARRKSNPAVDEQPEVKPKGKTTPTSKTNVSSTVTSGKKGAVVEAVKVEVLLFHPFSFFLPSYDERRMYIHDALGTGRSRHR